MSDSYRISIEVLENGFTVECPDFEAVAAAKKADAKKSGNYPTYIGDKTKTYTAKTVKEVLARIKECLEEMPESEFDAHFSAASAAADKD